MMPARLAEIRRHLVERSSGAFSAEVNPWELVEELTSAYGHVLEFLETVRQPIGDLTEALDEVSR